MKSKAPIERYEALTVLAEGCRHLAMTCVTKGARGMLSNFADAIDREVAEEGSVGLAAFFQGKMVPSDERLAANA